MKKSIILLMILAMPLVYAADYYADLEANIDATGLVSIKGSTNYQSILTDGTEQYTSNDKGVRLVKIETQEQFSDYIIKLNFPDGAAINYVKTSGTFRIESNGKLSIIALGQDKPISIIAQYRIQRASKSYLPYLLLIPLAIIIFYLINIRRKPEQKKAQLNLKGLSHRQKQIMELLAEKDKPMTQTEIEEELKLPKSSVSRNVHTLELKGLIEKEKTGMSNKIHLKKQ